MKARTDIPVTRCWGLNANNTRCNRRQRGRFCFNHRGLAPLYNDYWERKLKREEGKE